MLNSGESDTRWQMRPPNTQNGTMSAGPDQIGYVASCKLERRYAGVQARCRALSRIFSTPSGKKLFSRILVGIDGSSASVAALAHAIRLAEAEKSAVRVLSVVERVPSYVGLGPGFDRSATLAQSLHETSEAALARARDLLTLTGAKGEKVLFGKGDESVVTVAGRAGRVMR